MSLHALSVYAQIFCVDLLELLKNCRTRKQSGFIPCKTDRHRQTVKEASSESSFKKNIYIFDITGDEKLNSGNIN